MGDRVRLELRNFGHAALGPDTGIWPKLPLLGALFYLFGPIDLIPYRLHWYGFADELFFLLAALLACRILAPELPSGSGATPGWIARIQFRLRILQADFANFYLLQHRRENGFIFTSKNSGSHWLKFMLNHALAAQFGVQPPQHSTGPTADYLVGKGGMMRPYPHLPHFSMSHTIPSGFFAWRFAFRLVPERPIVVLVRDPEPAICSNFCKWGSQYNASLDAFVRGDPTGKRHVADIWWYMHFFNRWGDVAQAHPHQVLLVHYEALRQDTGPVLHSIAAHLGVTLRPGSLAAGLAVSGRETMRAFQDAEHGEIVVPDEAVRAGVRLSVANRKLLAAILARHLRHRLGCVLPA